MKEELKAKVIAVNFANDYANKLFPKLHAIFAPLIGQTLTKNDGSLMAKYVKLLPELPCTPRLNVYRTSGTGWLDWTVKTCQNIEGGTSCVYHETLVSVGRLERGVLVALQEPMSRRTDYTVEEILAKRAEAARLEGLWREARNACEPFGPG